MNDFKISLLIPTMNRPESLKDTLLSYMNSITIPDQIVVVDQSKDEETINKTRRILESYSKKTEVNFVHLDKPSLTAARNTAISLAKNEIIVCSDDDINVMEDTLSNVTKIMSECDIALIAGQDIFSKNKGSNILGYFMGTRSFQKRNIGHVTKSLLGRYPYIEDDANVMTEWAMGYFFVIRKSLLLSSNILWDENLREYAFNEDLDFSFRYCKYSYGLGMKCILTNQVIVKHKVSKEYRVENDKELLMYVAHRAYLHYKLGYGTKHSINHTNRCMLLYFWLTRKNYKGMKKAMTVTKKHINEIMKGNFDDVY